MYIGPFHIFHNWSKFGEILVGEIQHIRTQFSTGIRTETGRSKCRYQERTCLECGKKDINYLDEKPYQKLIMPS